MKPLFERYANLFIVISVITVGSFFAIAFSGILPVRVFADALTSRLSPPSSCRVSLPLAIKRALSNQFEIIRARHTVDRYMALKKASYSALLPGVSVVSGGIWTQTKNDLPLFASANGMRELVGQVRLTVPIFNPKDYAEISLADSNLNLAEYKLKLARLIVAAQVVRYFYGLGLLNREIKIKQKALDKIENILNATKKEYKTGNLPYLDVVQTELMVTKLQTGLNILKLKANAVKKVLAMVIFCKNKKLSVILPQSRLNYSRSLPSLDSLFLKAVKKQPLIDAARAEIQSARAEVGISKAGRLPKIIGGSAYGLDTVNSPDVPNLGWQFFLFLDVPVFNFGLNGDYIDASKQRLMAVKSAESALELSVKKRVTMDYGRTKSLIKAMAGTKMLVKQSRSVFKMTREGYLVGALNALALQEAQDNYLKARLELAKMAGEVYESFAQLDIDIGIIPVNIGKL